MSKHKNLLWVDCIAAGVAGVLMLLLSGWLSRWYHLSQHFMLFLGAVNLAYAAYSFSLARRPIRPMVLVQVLACANMTWGIACFAMAAYFWGTASVFGILHLVGEGIFVGGLGAVEWRVRGELLGE